jgi:SHS2 domain-containing protein
MASNYELFEHEADVGIKGYGSNIEEAFENGAKAMFSIMVDLKKVETKTSVEVNCQAEDLEGLFVEWLNQLLAQKDIDGTVYSKFKVTIQKKDNNYHLQGSALGEELNMIKHSVKIEVKAATYHMLKVAQENGFFIAQCVVDV